MKKTPLRRKTPLKRAGFKKKGILDTAHDKLSQLSRKPKRKRRSGLRPVSKAKESWMKQYREMCRTDTPLQRDENGRLMHKDWLERHHPWGRIGERILAYVYITSELHEWIHAHSKEALSLGWLTPEYKGHVNSGKWPRPWSKQAEARWPASLKRK